MRKRRYPRLVRSGRGSRKPGASIPFRPFVLQYCGNLLQTAELDEDDYELLLQHTDSYVAVSMEIEKRLFAARREQAAADGQEIPQCTAARPESLSVDRQLCEAASLGGTPLLRQSINLIVEAFLETLPRRRPSVRQQPRLRRLGEMFGLNTCETEYLLFAYCRERVNWFDNIINSSINCQVVEDVARVIRMAPGHLRECISPDGRLLREGLLTVDDKTERLSAGPSEIVQDYLDGLVEDPFQARLRPDEGEAYDLDSYQLDALDMGMLQQLVRDPVPRDILLHGLPGTGKTELARSLARAAGKQALFLQLEQGRDALEKRAIQIKLIRRRLHEHPPGRQPHEQVKPILVIDEVDDVLNTAVRSRFPTKEWLTGLLDETGITTIWITNTTWGIHPAVQRRFDFAQLFESLDSRRRLIIWQHVHAEHAPHIPLDTAGVQLLLRRYAPSPAQMAAALRVLAGGQAARQDRPASEKSSDSKELPESDARPAQDPQHDVLERLEAVFRSQQRLHSGDVPVPSLENITRVYDPGFLHTDTRPDRILAAVLRYFQHMENTGRAAGMSAGPGGVGAKGVAVAESPVAAIPPGGFNLLFWGEPGTGKTEFAKYLARETGRELLIRRASDLLSKYVGESEKLIAAAFREAQAAGSILLLDEADSLLYDRGSARHSWERTQVNELLTWMENFRGVLVCCTNLLDALDTASARRFALKVEFKPLEAHKNPELFRRMFAAELSTADAARLSGRTDLRPGDFKNAAQRVSLGILDGACPSAIIEAVCTEADFRARSGTETMIGFRAG